MSVFRVGLLLFFVIVVIVLGFNLARAENLEAAKSGPKLFSSNCSMCHSSPRVLAKRMNNWALTDFLQKHYTASQAAAHELAAYLLAAGSHSPGCRISDRIDYVPAVRWNLRFQMASGGTSNSA